MRAIVEMTQKEIEDTLLKIVILEKENHANRWTAILAVIALFGCFFG
jgi:hypothetical protein